MAFGKFPTNDNMLTSCLFFFLRVQTMCFLCRVSAVFLSRSHTAVTVSLCHAIKLPVQAKQHNQACFRHSADDY